MDTQQQPPQDDQVVSQQQPQPITPSVQGQSTQQTQTEPEKDEQASISVPSVSREGEPVAVSRSEIAVSASVPEIDVSPELQKETGMEAVHETPQLTPADTQAGISHAKESVPVSPAPATTITLPMTQQQAQQTVKMHKKVKDSLFWFAMLILRQWQIAQKAKEKVESGR